jgi:hypothetical protein
MSTLSLRLPNDLLARLRGLARRDGVSVNEFIALAVAEKAAVLGAEDALAQRAGRGRRARFEAALARVPDVAPLRGDDFAGQVSEGPPPGRVRRRRR